MSGYRSLVLRENLDRRDFLKIGGAAGIGLWLGNRSLSALAQQTPAPPARPKTNIEAALQVPKTKYSLPGLFPGKVIEVRDAGAVKDDKPVAKVVHRMFEKGLHGLTKKGGKDSFAFFFTPERYPGITIEGLQTMDEAAAMGQNQDNSRWLKPDGTHVSVGNFDQEAYYWADVEGPKDSAYLNQHVFNGKFSYFGKLLTKRLTKIINVPVFKKTGNGISMGTKNLGYGAVCNTNRLHGPLFFDVNTEMMAFLDIRDQLLPNVTHGLQSPYE